MRILFLSNYYPPGVRGGYEQWCEEVAHELVQHGHSVCVLTSKGTSDHWEPPITECSGLQVQRILHLEVESGLLESTLRLVRGTRARFERENLDRVRHVVSTVKPDAALIWGMWNVPRSVPALVEHLLDERVAFYFCDYWPSLPSAYLQQWQAPPRRSISGLPKQILGRPILAQLTKEPPIPLKLKRPICVSQAVRDVLVSEGVPVEHAEVIYGGTRSHDFEQARNPIEVDGAEQTLRVLYAGRVTATKGVHTAIHALARLAERGEDRIILDVVGRGDSAYEDHLRDLVHSYQLDDRVRFRGSVSRAEMPRVMAEQDVLVLLSEWEEPFARIVLEAMAARLVVVGSLTGGTGEVLVENENGLTFPRGDVEVLANQLQRLRRDPGLRARLSAAGRCCVEEQFTLTRMVEQLERVLEGIAAQPC